VRLSTDERVEFCCWLAAAENALVFAQQSQAVSEGRRKLRQLRYIFTGADHSHEPDAARQEISILVDELMDTAIVDAAHTSLALDASVDTAIDSLAKAVDVLRPHLDL
jgi:hypothetical protein